MCANTHTKLCVSTSTTLIVVVQLLSCVWLFAAPCIVAYQASLSFIISRSQVKCMSIELVRWCYLTISSSAAPFSFCLQSFPESGSFPVGSLHQVAKVLELQLQHQSFQWIIRVDFPLDGLVWSPCSPRNSLESSPASQFESIKALVISLLYGPTLMCVPDY